MIEKLKIILCLTIAFCSWVPAGQADGTFRSTLGAEIAYQEVGNAKLPSVVLIHGFPVNHEMWAFQVAALKESYRVITYDLRGMGQSKSLDGQDTLELFVDDFFALLDHLKIERTTVVGFSMGGYVALRAIERNPSRFQSLVLADTQSAADTDQGKLNRTVALKAVKTGGLHSYGQTFIQAALSLRTRQETPRIVEKVTQMIESNTTLGVSGGLLAILSRTDTTANLSQIKIPTLILVGDEDSITPKRLSQVMSKQISGSVLKIISGAGHFTPLENPKEFNLNLLDFLERRISN